jgi:hypothetical protein
VNVRYSHSLCWDRQIHSTLLIPLPESTFYYYPPLHLSLKVFSYYTVSYETSVGISSHFHAFYISRSLLPSSFDYRNSSRWPITWPRSLSHEPSSPAQTLGSWVRILLKTCMSVCVYSVSVLSCVQVAALRRADPQSKESYHLCKKDYENEVEARAQQRVLEPLMNE